MFNSITAWHLSTIETNQPGEKVRYTYHDAQSYTVLSDITSYETWYTNLCVYAGNAPYSVPHIVNYSDNSAIIDVRHPKEIFFPGGKILFVEEYHPPLANYGKPLDRIQIYGYDFTNDLQQKAGQYTRRIAGYSILSIAIRSVISGSDLLPATTIYKKRRSVTTCPLAAR